MSEDEKLRDALKHVFTMDCGPGVSLASVIRTGMAHYYADEPEKLTKAVEWIKGQVAANALTILRDQKPLAHFQWNEGWGHWEQVVDEAAGEEGVIAVFTLRDPVDDLPRMTEAELLEALEATSPPLTT